MKKVVLEVSGSVPAGGSLPAWVGLKKCLKIGFLLLLTLTTAKASIPKQPGVWLSQESDYKLNESQETQLVRSLRRITGLPALKFERNGRLSLGDVSQASGGSEIARQILSCVLGSGDVFVIEGHSGSPSVNFGQMDEGMNYEDLRVQCQRVIWRVRLDFDDFRLMQAPPQVRESFDAGFTMLHELLHGLGYRDAQSPEEIGDCEEVVNQVRTELGVLLRDQYFAESLRIKSNVHTLRLRFREVNTDNGVLNRLIRRRSHYLFFLLPSDNQQ